VHAVLMRSVCQVYVVRIDAHMSGKVSEIWVNPGGHRAPRVIEVSASSVAIIHRPYAVQGLDTSVRDTIARGVSSKGYIVHEISFGDILSWHRS
jgi:CTP:molybdopterin cytidylyltransferase MocA